MAITVGATGIWNAGLRFGDRDAAVEAAAAAEEFGYGAVWIPDIGGDDLFPRLRQLLERTSRITVATGILNLWMHDAAVVGRQYAELAEGYPDRLLLGIGVSHGPLIEQSGVGEYRKPLSKMNSYLDELDAASPTVPQEARVLAALGPKMLATARDRSAGAHPYLVIPEHNAIARDVLGPDRLLAPEVGVVLETDPHKARDIARAGISMYFGLPNYVNNWRRFGFTDQDVTAPGSDRLIDALVAWGDEDAIAEKLRAHRDAGADHIAVQVLCGERGGEVSFPIEAWRRLAPVLLG